LSHCSQERSRKVERRKEKPVHDLGKKKEEGEDSFSRAGKKGSDHRKNTYSFKLFEKKGKRGGVPFENRSGKKKETKERKRKRGLFLGKPIAKGGGFLKKKKKKVATLPERGKGKNTRQKKNPALGKKKKKKKKSSPKRWVGAGGRKRGLHVPPGGRGGN